MWLPFSDQPSAFIYILWYFLRMKKNPLKFGANGDGHVLLKEAFRASLASRLPWLPGPPCGTGAVGGPPAPATGGAV